MYYYSLHHEAPNASFRQATLRGQAPDGGLYFPASVPPLAAGFIDGLKDQSKEEIAWAVMHPYVGTDIPEEPLRKIIAETVSFDFPLVQLEEHLSVLELFHGPTLAFKDVGARFMSRCLGYFVKDSDQPVTVLVATSGDTGGAVASGFHGIDGIRVVILYPSGKVSSVQELQLTTLGGNISAIEVMGTFDDCQRMVKQAFADTLLNSRLSLTSANSINVARWLPQQCYYLFACRQWEDKKNPPVFCVPSGNFGNLCAGLLAHRSGMPARHFIAACNANRVVPDYLATGHYLPARAVATLSNAMDVGDPSNFVRILELFDQSFESLKTVVSSDSITDEQTRQAIAAVHTGFGYLMDPHGAVGYLALRRYLSDHPGQKGIFLETAHPVKFPEVIQEVIHQPVPVPEGIRALLGAEKKSMKMEASYTWLRDYLLS